MSFNKLIKEVKDYFINQKDILTKNKTNEQPIAAGSTQATSTRVAAIVSTEEGSVDDLEDAILTTYDYLNGLDYDSLQGLIFAYLFLMERHIQKNGITLHEKETFDAISKKFSTLIVEQVDDNNCVNRVPLTRRGVLAIISSINVVTNQKLSKEAKAVDTSLLLQCGISEEYVNCIAHIIKKQPQSKFLEIMQNLNPKAQKANFIHICIYAKPSRKSYDEAIKSVDRLLQDPKEQLLDYNSRASSDPVIRINSGPSLGWRSVLADECPILDTAQPNTFHLYCSYIPLSSKGYIPSILITGLYYIKDILQLKLSNIGHNEGEQGSDGLRFLQDPFLTTQNANEIEQQAQELNTLRKREQKFYLPSQKNTPSRTKLLNTIADDNTSDLLNLLSNKTEKNVDQPTAFLAKNSSNIHLFNENEGWELIVRQSPNIQY